MRSEPTWRIPIGVLALCAMLLVYGLLVANLVAPLIADWPTLGQLPIYIVLGVVWIMPLKRFLFWMEHGRLR